MRRAYTPGRPALPAPDCRICSGTGETDHGARCACTYNKDRAAKPPAFPIKPDTVMTIQRGEQSGEMKWSKIAFEYIGAKSPALGQVARDIEQTGQAVWEGQQIIHPAAGQ